MFENYLKCRIAFGSYWLYMLTLGVWRVLVRYDSVTVCIFQFNFFIEEKRPKVWIILTWKWKCYHVASTEFSRNICSNDHETPFPSSSNTQFELLLTTRTRSSVGMGKSLVTSSTVDRIREKEGDGPNVPNIVFSGIFF